VTARPALPPPPSPLAALPPPPAIDTNWGDMEHSWEGAPERRRHLLTGDRLTEQLARLRDLANVAAADLAEAEAEAEAASGQRADVGASSEARGRGVI
jgi:hypothetical protein